MTMFAAADFDWLLSGAILWDVLFCEPTARWHPVVWIGRLIGLLERRLPRRGRPAFISGIGLAVGVPLVTVGVALVVLQLSSEWPALRFGLAVWLLTSSFSIRMLGREAKQIAGALSEGDLSGARHRLSRLCSRDATDLAPHEVAGAAIESVAENASDSFVAPLFWYCLFGVPGALCFRCVNTLDTMVGYRGEYELLGRASARLDDVLCWIPARLTTVLFLVVGVFAGTNPRQGLAVLRKDAQLTSSPNAGVPMAAMAGLLGVSLSKRDEYQLGAEGAPASPAALYVSVRMFYYCVAAATGIALTYLHYEGIPK